MKFLAALFHRHAPDQPCPHMVPLLHDAAGGRAMWLTRWYVLAHTARCGPCRRFLESVEVLLHRLREGSAGQEDQDALARLAQGDWRQQG